MRYPGIQHGYDVLTILHQYFITDHLGNTRATIDTDGTLSGQADYLPYGRIFWENGVNYWKNRYLWTGKELLTTIFDRTVYDSGARFLFTDGSFASIDPYAEKYPWISPYAYCAGNPINLADPDGRDVYSYNKQTGVFSLIKTTDDNYDSVVKQNKNGDIKKTLIKNVEKGILCDGANFMTKENVIEVNKKNAPSLEGVERFTIDLTRVAGKEIAGAYYSEKGDGVVSHISIGRYDVNETHRSNNPGTNSLGHMFGPGYEQHITGLYHTHPQDRHYSWEQRKSPSDTDKKSKMNQLQFFPHISFYILTQPEYGVNEYKFQY